MHPPLRICFAGTPEFAAAHLQSMLESRHQVVAAYTQPDRPAGRGRRPQPSPVKQLAEKASLPVLQPVSLSSLQSLAPPSSSSSSEAVDVLVVVAYGLVLPPAVLALPRYGCLNVHASLLPRWRGAAPIERAILAGDRQSGVTIMQMDAGLDTGPILHTTAVPIAEDETRLSLEARLTTAGRAALLEVLDDLPGFLSKAQPQDEADATYAKRLDKAEALIHWRETAVQIGRQIRAAVGRLPAYTWFKGQRLRLLEAKAHENSGDDSSDGSSPGRVMAIDRDSFTVACGSGSLQVTSVQAPGRRATSARDFLNAHPLAVGDGFSDAPSGSAA